MAHSNEHGNDIYRLSTPPESSPAKTRDAITALAKFASESANHTLDPAVKACLPSSCVFRALYPHGSANWSRTAAISTVQDGTPMNFFMKLTRGNVGHANLLGEYASMQAIHSATPGFCPEPIAAGTYESDKDVHFYIASYVDMTDEVPEVESLPPRLAELHTKAISPNGKFGFPVTTKMGAAIQPNTWMDSWEDFFSRLITVIFDVEQDVHGLDNEMQEMQQIVLGKVIPRLLRPLETGGNTIQPRFVHGNLWDGNTSVDAATDEAQIFDASGMYAHNEYDLGAWNLPRHKIYRAYIKEYQRYFPPSVPEEDFEDRLMLYRYRFNLTSSSCYLDSLRFRELVIEDMRYLTSKYKEGYRGSAPKKGQMVTINSLH